MATVVSITNPVTGAVEQVDKLDATAQQIDDAVSLAPQISNPNLLDNWYFANPVNQRGQTEYTAAGYTIDRWLQGFDGTLTSTLTDDGIKIAAGNDGTYKNFEQILSYVPTNTTFTLSFLVDNFASISQIYTGFSASQFDIRDNLITCTFKTGGSISGRKLIGIQVKPGKTATIKAAKLELGSQQTLAHQNTDGNWVLNEIPDYGEQLARCQRYLFTPTTQTDSIYNLAIGVGTSTTTIAFFLPLPTTMRAKSSITFSGLHAVNEINSMLAITKVSNYGQVYNGVWLQATVASGAEVGKAYYLRTSNPWSLVLDANL